MAIQDRRPGDHALGDSPRGHLMGDGITLSRDRSITRMRVHCVQGFKRLPGGRTVVRNGWFGRLRDESGQALVLSALLIVMLLGFAAFSVDIGNAFLAQRVARPPVRGERVRQWRA